MRGIATALFVGFVSIILFGIIAPAVVEPMAEFVVEQAPGTGPVDVNQFQGRLYSVLFVWAPLFVLGSGVASAVVWYFRKERVSARRRR